MSDRNEKKILARMQAHILSPALSAKERDESMIKYLRLLVESTNDTVYGKYIHQHGSLLLTQFDNHKIGTLTLVERFNEILQLGRELQEAYDKADA